MKNVLTKFTFLASCFFSPGIFASENVPWESDNCDLDEFCWMMPLDTDAQQSQLPSQTLDYQAFYHPLTSVFEHEITELLESRALDPTNLENEEKLIKYAQNFPQTFKYHVLSKGEISLMSWPVYKFNCLQEDAVQSALQSLFIYKFSSKRILSVFKMSKSFIINDNANFPKQFFDVFVKMAFELFSMVLRNIDLNPSANQSEKKVVVFQIFEKLLEYCIEAHVIKGEEVKKFNFDFIQTFPDIFIDLDTEIQFKICVGFIYWDDLESLMATLDKSSNSIFHIHQFNGHSLMHYAVKMASVKCLNFVLDLLYEMALKETEMFMSPFVYAIKLQNKFVLKTFAEHGCNGSTVITIDAVNFTAKEFALLGDHLISYSFFCRR